MRHQENFGAAHLSAADGVVAHKSHSGVSDHPVRFASTPPHEEGTRLVATLINQILSKSSIAQPISLPTREANSAIVAKCSGGIGARSPSLSTIFDEPSTCRIIFLCFGSIVRRMHFPVALLTRYVSGSRSIMPSFALIRRFFRCQCALPHQMAGIKRWISTGESGDSVRSRRSE